MIEAILQSYLDFRLMVLLVWLCTIQQLADEQWSSIFVHFSIKSDCVHYTTVILFGFEISASILSWPQMHNPTSRILSVG